jgi:hypothetical protein
MQYTTIVRFNSPHQAGLVLEARLLHEDKEAAFERAEEILANQTYRLERDGAFLFVPWHNVRGVEVLPGDHTQDNTSFFAWSIPIDLSPLQ